MKVIFSRILLKISLLGIILVALSLSVFSLIIIRIQRTELSREIMDRGKVFAEFSASSMYQDYVSFYSHPTEGEFQRFGEKMRYSLEKNGDIANATLMAINGKVLFDSDEIYGNDKYAGEARYIRDEGALELAKKESVSFRDIEFEGKKATEIFAPVRELTGSHVVSMKYILTYDSLDAKLSTVYGQIILASIVVFVAAFFLAIPFSMTLTGPIVKLTGLTERISRGELDIMINVHSKDEIGRLAHSFSTMAGSLKKYREKIEEHSRDLEKKVDERTKDLDKKNIELEKLNLELRDKYSDIERFNKLMVDRELKMVEMKKEIARLKKE